tara:strand:+ start:406 stop:564 length:159 start_codon:yes stop_codon:yes gene_type:complete
MNRKRAEDRKSERLNTRIRKEQMKRLEKYKKENHKPSRGHVVREMLDKFLPE